MLIILLLHIYHFALNCLMIGTYLSLFSLSFVSFSSSTSIHSCLIIRHFCCCLRFNASQIGTLTCRPARNGPTVPEIKWIASKLKFGKILTYCFSAKNSTSLGFISVRCSFQSIDLRSCFLFNFTELKATAHSNFVPLRTRAICRECAVFLTQCFGARYKEFVYVPCFSSLEGGKTVTAGKLENAHLSVERRSFRRSREARRTIRLVDTRRALHTLTIKIAYGSCELRLASKFR